jgi:hypothetical protein
VTWKVWNKAIEEAFTEEEDITHQLGEWYDEGGHQQTELHLNAREGKERYINAIMENGNGTRRKNEED